MKKKTKKYNKNQNEETLVNAQKTGLPTETMA